MLHRNWHGCVSKGKVNVMKKQFEEAFRRISDEVGRLTEINNYSNDYNPYKESYKLVKEYINGDIEKLMQLKAECSLNSYEYILSAAIKILLGVISLLTYMWSIVSIPHIYDDWFMFVSIIYVSVALLIIFIIASVHKRYKYVGIGEKYVKLAIDILIKDYHVRW